MTSSDAAAPPSQALHDEAVEQPFRRLAVEVTAADGCSLGTLVYLPVTAGPFPTILTRTPYGAAEVVSFADTLGAAGAAQGYATVIQDVRGRFDSAGDFSFGEHDQQDALATLDWIVDQPWSDGAVAARGESAPGLMAWLAAATGHPAVKTIVAGVTAGVFDGLGYYGRGVVQPDVLVGWVGNLLLPDVLARTGQSIEDPDLRALAAGDTSSILVSLLTLSPGQEARAAELMQQLADLTAVNRDAVIRLSRDPARASEAIGQLVPWVAGWLAHPDPDDPFWGGIDYSTTARALGIPGLHFVGWHDICLRGTIRNFVDAHQAGIAPQRLVISPYTHAGALGPVGSWTPPLAPQPDGMSAMGTTSAPEPDLIHEWLAHHLHGRPPSGAETRAPISLYVQKADTWREEWEWPLARTDWIPLYLDSDGSANSADGDGRLTDDVPATERADRFTYDPADPVPSAGGTHLGTFWPAGIFDQAAVEERPDVLVYTSEPYERGLEVTGPVALTLYADTSAVDTDFTAKLTDVDADGVSTNVCDGVTRLRFRADQPGPVEPGSRQQVRIELSPTSYFFAPGHRVRLQVSSSNFPLQQPNSNTGRNEWVESVTPVVAQQAVHHGGVHPSALVLPVIPAVSADGDVARR